MIHAHDRCGQRLLGSNPYQHFSTPGKKCYQKLFDASELGEDDWQPMEGFAVLGGE
jgi:E3 ubiquitin-protein ligase RNF14